MVGGIGKYSKDVLLYKYILYIYDISYVKNTFSEYFVLSYFIFT